jgi:hypothetical protein
MSRKPPANTRHISNPAAFLGQGSVILIEVPDEDSAIKEAQKFARETGRAVIVVDAENAVIATIPATRTH